MTKHETELHRSFMQKAPATWMLAGYALDNGTIGIVQLSDDVYAVEKRSYSALDQPGRVLGRIERLSARKFRAVAVDEQGNEAPEVYNGSLRQAYFSIYRTQSRVGAADEEQPGMWETIRGMEQAAVSVS